MPPQDKVNPDMWAKRIPFCSNQYNLYVLGRDGTILIHQILKETPNTVLLDDCVREKKDLYLGDLNFYSKDDKPQ